MRWRTRVTDPHTGLTRIALLREQRIGPEFYSELEDLIERGANSQELIDRIVEVTESSGNRIAKDLRRISPRMLREQRHLKRRLQRQTKKVWGAALDRLYQVYLCAEELGSNLQQLSDDADKDAISEALIGLHARACLVTREVHALLTAGFPLAAMSRARTLHETAVIATVIGVFAEEEENADLAIRFLEHWVVDVARDYRAAQEAGIQVDQTDLTYVTAERDRLVEKYGRIFDRDYGWAACLFPNKNLNKDRVNFAELEKKVETELNRLDYKLQSHHVHASALTVMLHKYQRNGRSWYITRPIDTGFAEPATATLAALMASTSALVLYGLPDSPEPIDLVALAAIRQLATEAVSAFEQSQENINSH